MKLKKIFLALVGLTFAMSSHAALSTCYIIGDLQPGGWDSKTGIECKNLGNGVFSYDLICYGNTYFAFTSVRGEWSNVNSNRWGLNPQAQVKVGDTKTLVKGEYTMFVSAGSYTLTFDTNNWQLKVEAYTGKIDYPDALYILGTADANGNAWNPSQGVKMSSTGEGTYEATNVKFSQSAAFSFCTELSSNSGSWSVGSRYGAGSGYGTDKPFVSGTTMDLYGGSDVGAFTGAAGTYNITVDLPNMKMTATAVGEVNLPTTMYIVGNVAELKADNNWNPMKGIAMDAGSKAGIFTATGVELSEAPGDSYGYFSFATSLANDENWGGIGARYGVYSNTLVTGEAQDLFPGAEQAFYAYPGTYDITIDLNESTMTAVAQEVKIDYPENMYVIGTLGSGNWTVPGKAMTTGENGIYTIEDLNLSQGGGNAYFALTSVGTDDWDSADGINANRFGPANDNAEISLDNNTATVSVSKGNTSWQIEPGTYTLTFDFGKSTLTVLKTGAPQPSPMEEWWVNLNGAFIDSDNGKQPVEGIASWENVPISDNEFYIKIWNGVEDLYYASSNAIQVGVWTEMNQVDAETNSSIQDASVGNIYNVQYNVEKNEIYIELITPEISVPETLFIIGTLPTGIWDPSEGIKMNNEGDDTFTAKNVVLIPDTEDTEFAYLSFTSNLSDDWDNLEQRFGANNVDNSHEAVGEVNGEVEMPLVNAPKPGAFQITPGYYNITVNFEEKPIVTFEKSDSYSDELEFDITNGSISGTTIEGSVEGGEDFEFTVDVPVGTLWYMFTPTTAGSSDSPSSDGPSLSQFSYAAAAAGQWTEAENNKVSIAITEVNANTGTIQFKTNINGVEFPISTVYNYMVSNDVTGVDVIGAEAGDVEFFDLQGVKVANPEKGGIYIKVVNGKAEKVVL